MADIAILVAEEYERRSRPMIINSTNDNKHKGEDGHGGGSGWGHQKFDEGVSWMKKAGEEKFDEYAKKVFDPKTTFALEAINGLFSA